MEREKHRDGDGMDMMHRDDLFPKNPELLGTKGRDREAILMIDKEKR